MSLPVSRVMKRMVSKEIRENIRWLPVGLLVIGATCWMVRPTRDYGTAQVMLAADLVTHFAIVTPLLAFALGIVQAYRDLQPAAAAYLNHRSVTASQIFLAKAVAGFALYAIALTVPVLLLAIWIAYHGMVWHPMRPAQVLPALMFGLVSFGLHPAAMLMMSRGASWWGTRLFPLIPSAAVLIPFFAALRTGGIQGAGICLLVAIPLLAWMATIAGQGWKELSTEPPASRFNSRLRHRWLLPTYLGLASLICLFTAVVFGIGILEEARRTRSLAKPFTREAIDKATGEPWLLTAVQKFDQQTGIHGEKLLGGDRIAQAKSVDPMAAINIEASRFRSLTMLTPLRQGYYSSDGFFSVQQQIEGTPILYSYDHRGYLICYSRNDTAWATTWTKTLAADGVYSAGALAGTPFTVDPVGIGSLVFEKLRKAGYSTPLIDNHGVYLLAKDTLSVQTFIDRSIDAAAMLETDEDHAPHLVLQSGAKLYEYQFVDANGVDTWYQAVDTVDQSYRPQRTGLGELGVSAKLLHTYPAPGGGPIQSYYRLGWTDGGLFAVGFDRPREVLRLVPENGSEAGRIETISYAIDPSAKTDAEKDSVHPETIFSGLFPGGLGLAIGAVATYLSVTGQVAPPAWEKVSEYPVTSATMAVSYVLVTLVAIWLTRITAKRRGLSRRQTALWCWSVLLLGLAAPLSVIAIYRQVVREPCPGCDRLARVDLPRCEHCGTGWQPAAAEGIEIHDQDLDPAWSAGAAV